MTDIIRSLLSRAPRYRIKADDLVQVTLHRRNADDESIDAKLANLSVGGAKLRIGRQIAVTETVSVTIRGAEPTLQIDVSATVCWTDPAPGDVWWLGCSFEPKIPVDVLYEFAENGVLERREHSRQRIAVRTLAQRELDHEQVAVWILNYSHGGFCLLSQHPIKTDERILLLMQLEDGVELVIRGKIRWQVQSHEGYVIGCSFVDIRDFGVLRDLGVADADDLTADAMPTKHSPARPPWTTLAAAGATGLALGLLAMSANLPERNVEIPVADAQPLDAQTLDAPLDAQPLDAQPLDAQPLDAQPLDAQPLDAQPLDAQPLDSQPLDSQPLDSHQPAQVARHGPHGPKLTEQPTISAADPTEPAVTGQTPEQPLQPEATSPVEVPVEVTPAVPLPSGSLDYRSWTDATGRFKIYAKMVGFDGDTVWLELVNGDRTSVQFDFLTPQDADLARQVIAAGAFDVNDTTGESIQ